MRPILTVPIARCSGDGRQPCQDLLAVEEPLEIRIGEQPVSITMRTPGYDLELAAGFLFSEGIINDAAQIESAEQDGNVVSVHLHGAPELDRLQRHFYTSSSCGICGKASLNALHAAGCEMLSRDAGTIASEIVHGLPDALRESQQMFDRTGGLHASALFDDTGRLLAIREDVGRHNALDKLIGAEFLAGRTPLHHRVVLVSGRVSFELVQKAAMAGIPVLAAVGAPSSLAVETGRRFGMALVGFVRDHRFNIYSGDWRIV